MTNMMNAQKHMVTLALETGLSSVRSDYQYGWNLIADIKPECANTIAFTPSKRKLHTTSSGSVYNRLKRSA